MKITIYELLGMIKDGKAPDKIKFHNIIYELKDKFEDSCRYVAIYGEREGTILGTDFILTKCLDDEIEILEEEKKIPEKITPESMIKSNQSINDDIIDKINEIIDYLESKGE